MKRLLIALLLLVALLLPACSADESVYIQTDPGNPVLIETETMDDSTHAITTISVPHHKVHEGEMYSVSQNGDLSNGASQDTLIITPDSTIWAHLTISIETEAEASYIFYESANITDPGASITPVNRNRNSTNTSVLFISYNATVADPGTPLHREHWGTSKSRGGEERSEQEWVLKQNASYILRVTNETTSENYISTVLIWYEHEDLE